MANNDSSVLGLATTELNDSRLAAFKAFQEEWQSFGTLNFVQTYTQIAADAHPLPEFQMIDPTEPPQIDKPGTYHQELDINGIPRTYTIHVPPQYDGKKPMPVVIMLHGHGEDGEQFAQMTNIDQEADKEGFIAIYPDAVQWFGDKDLSAWDTNDGLVPPGSDSNDIGFVNSIIDTTEKQLSVDQSRVYLAGYSNGGMLAQAVAKEYPNKIAAIAMVSSGQNNDQTSLSSPVSELSIHGTDDDVIPIFGIPGGDGTAGQDINEAGIPNFDSYNQATQYWVSQDGITSPPQITTTGDVTEKNYTGGKDGSQVLQYTVAAGTHNWFGAPGETGPDDSINATNVMWNFFSQHSK